MNERMSERLAGLSTVTALFASITWLFSMIPLRLDLTGHDIEIFPLLLYACIFYLLTTILLERGVNASLFIIVTILGMGLGAFLFVRFTVLEPLPLMTMFCYTLFYMGLLAIGAVLAQAPISRQTVLVIFDITVILLILHLLLHHAGAAGLSGRVTPACGAAIFVSLVSLTESRIHMTEVRDYTAGSVRSGRILMAGLLLLVGASAWLISAVSSEGISQVGALLIKAALTLKNLLLRLAKLILLGLDMFFTWLSRFFDPDSYEPIPEEPGAGTMIEMEQEELTLHLPLWVYIAVIALLVLLILFVIFRLRKVRLGGASRRRASEAGITRTDRSREALKALFARLKKALRFRRDLFLKRNTPAGLLIYCEKKYRKKSPRLPAESGHAWLRRIAALQDEDARLLLLKLSDSVEQEFYGTEKTAFSESEGRMIRKNLRS